MLDARRSEGGVGAETPPPVRANWEGVGSLHSWPCQNGRLIVEATPLEDILVLT